MQNQTPEIIIENIESLDVILKNIISIDVLLRQGNVVSAYRQGVQTTDLLKNTDYIKILNRSLLRIRKGEQIDALNDLKSLFDIIKKEKKNILIAALM